MCVGGGGATQEQRAVLPFFVVRAPGCAFLPRPQPLSPPAPAYSAGPALEHDLFLQFEFLGWNLGWRHILLLSLEFLGSLGLTDTPVPRVGCCRIQQVWGQGKWQALNSWPCTRVANETFTHRLGAQFFSCWATNLCVEVLSGVPGTRSLYDAAPAPGGQGPWDSAIVLERK